MSEQNLFNEDARKKLKELAESIDYTMLITALEAEPFHTVPMSTKEVDEAGNIWFLSPQSSTHNAYIATEGKVYLIYSDKGKMAFLTVMGQATIGKDRNRIKELYAKSDDSWFEGPEDPNITTIKVQPTDVHYWDTKHGKIVSLLKIAKGAITGNEPDLGVQGDLKV